VKLDFLTPGTGADVVTRSSMQSQSRAAGGRFELRDGWNVAVEYAASADAAAATVGWADVSHLTKLELQGASDALDAAAGTQLPFGAAVRRDDAWWCRLTQTRALVVGGRPVLGDAPGVAVVDVTCSFAALTLVGPLARETFARFCAIDLRPRVAPVRALRPGSVGRQPAIVIREGEQRFLFLFGWATSEYMWSVVTDAGGHLGGHPLGVDQLAAFPIAEPGAGGAISERPSMSEREADGA
jgi:heterotetrameric sarcosine oxidase gamma subunit